MSGASAGGSSSSRRHTAFGVTRTGHVRPVDALAVYITAMRALVGVGEAHRAAASVRREEEEEESGPAGRADGTASAAASTVDTAAGAGPAVGPPPAESSGSATPAGDASAAEGGSAPADDPEAREEAGSGSRAPSGVSEAGSRVGAAPARSGRGRTGVEGEGRRELGSAKQVLLRRALAFVAPSRRLAAFLLRADSVTGMTRGPSPRPGSEGTRGGQEGGDALEEELVGVAGSSHRHGLVGLLEDGLRGCVWGEGDMCRAGRALCGRGVLGSVKRAHQRSPRCVAACDLALELLDRAFDCILADAPPHVVRDAVAAALARYNLVFGPAEYVQEARRRLLDRVLAAFVQRPELLKELRPHLLTLLGDPTGEVRCAPIPPLIVAPPVPHAPLRRQCGEELLLHICWLVAEYSGTAGLDEEETVECYHALELVAFEHLARAKFDTLARGDARPQDGGGAVSVGRGSGGLDAQLRAASATAAQSGMMGFLSLGKAELEARACRYEPLPAAARGELAQRRAQEAWLFEQGFFEGPAPAAGADSQPDGSRGADEGASDGGAAALRLQMMLQGAATATAPGAAPSSGGGDGEEEGDGAPDLGVDTCAVGLLGASRGPPDAALPCTRLLCVVVSGLRKLASRSPRLIPRAALCLGKVGCRPREGTACLFS